MAAIALVGTVIMAILLLVVVLALARGIDWRSNEIFAPRESENLVADLAGSPIVWVLLFLGLTLGTTVVAILAVGGFGVSLPGGATAAMVPFGILLFAFIVAGTYGAVRDRDVSPAGATLATMLVLGALFLLAITGQILMGS